MIIKQLNLDCYQCEGTLNNSEELSDIIEKSATASGARVIDTHVQNYPQYGLTAVTFLAESHVLVCTYPEYRYAVVEVFMCNDQVSPEKCWEGIRDYLNPKLVKVNEWYHNIGEQP